jgi:hypothetical protein
MVLSSDKQRTQEEFSNRVLRKISGSDKEEVTGGC